MHIDQSQNKVPLKGDKHYLLISFAPSSGIGFYQREGVIHQFDLVTETDAPALQEDLKFDDKTLAIEFGQIYIGQYFNKLEELISFVKKEYIKDKKFIYYAILFTKGLSNELHSNILQLLDDSEFHEVSLPKNFISILQEIVNPNLIQLTIQKVNKSQLRNVMECLICIFGKDGCERALTKGEPLIATPIATPKKGNKIVRPDRGEYEILIGNSYKIQEIRRFIKIIAKTKATVLVHGEGGTGKKVVAGEIYKQSLRNGRPFIKVNCYSLNASLTEAELFGHENISHTGTVTYRKGPFELANKGTILLDGIGNMSMASQARLLRVIQEDEIFSVQNKKFIKVDVRVIATTDVVLKEAATKGAFREDLYYRLSVIIIFLPPLRERQEDIPFLVEHFIHLNSSESEKKVKGISSAAMDLLIKYNWPGNIHELKNVIAHAMNMEIKDKIYPEALPVYIKEYQQPIMSIIKNIQFNKELLAKDLDLHNQLLLYEKSLLLSALSRAKWVKSKTAKLLGINRPTLENFIKKHRIKMLSAKSEHKRRSDN